MFVFTDAGIDYGGGITNIDTETGIRYGVISQHSLNGDVVGEAEPVYPEKIEWECEDCGNVSQITSSDDVCPHCGEGFDNSSAWDYVDPIDWDYSPNDPDYSTSYSEDMNIVWFFKSPYYTYCKFCSPCVPGGGDLDTPATPETGIKAYCPGPDWFDEDSPCPYDIYKVETDELVQKRQVEDE